MAKRINEDFVFDGYYFKHITAPKKCDAMRRAILRRDVDWDIHEAYGRPSVYKARAWENCKALCEKLGGYRCVITGHNCEKFTVMFYFTSPETGVWSIARVTADGVTFCDEMYDPTYGDTIEDVWFDTSDFEVQHR